MRLPSTKGCPANVNTYCVLFFSTYLQYVSWCYGFTVLPCLEHPELTSFVLIFLSCEIIPSYVNIVRLFGLVVNQRSIRDGDDDDDDGGLLNIISSCWCYLIKCPVLICYPNCSLIYYNGASWRRRSINYYLKEYWSLEKGHLAMDYWIRKRGSNGRLAVWHVIICRGIGYWISFVLGQVVWLVIILNNNI